LQRLWAGIIPDMQIKEAPYWIALAHLPRWGAAKINALVIKFFHEEKISIEDFFHLDETKWKGVYGLQAPEVGDLLKVKSELPNLAFLAEDLLNEGFEIIPLNSPDYSPALKANLKATHSPVVLYTKGNKQLMKEKSVAIVGSRTASATSLDFTDNIAKRACKDYKVVVSGFAKGVDKQALDSAIKHKGQSIIVLPQGIMTFSTGFKNYYKQIVDGDILVLSTFHPKAPWKVELAMARNPIIYGLANEIYVAESSEKGGTWSGVLDGLRKNRKIYVRKPPAGEENANNILISKGAVAVDFEGKEISAGVQPIDIAEHTESIASEPLPEQAVSAGVTDDIGNMILSALNNTSLTSKELLEKLNLGLSAQKLTALIKKLPQVEVFKLKNKNQFRIKKQQRLFE
jgi:DNA processing protein